MVVLGVSELRRLKQLEEENNNPLTELLRSGAQKLIAQAVEAELELLLERHADLKLDDGRKAVVRNGYLPERKIQTGLGDVTVKVPKVRNCPNSPIFQHIPVLS